MVILGEFIPLPPVFIVPEVLFCMSAVGCAVHQSTAVKKAVSELKTTRPLVVKGYSFAGMCQAAGCRLVKLSCVWFTTNCDSCGNIQSHETLASANHANQVHCWTSRRRSDVPC